MAAAVPPGGVGIHAPPAAGLPVTIPHIFIRCRLAGADDTLDYVRCDDRCQLVAAFPNLGWLDASALGANQIAAPALTIQYLTCAVFFFTDWEGAPVVQQMADEELGSSFTPACLGTRADILESQGAFAKVYLATEAFVGALELAFDSAELPTTLVTLYRISAMFANAPNAPPNLGGRARRGPKTIFPPAHIRKGLSGAPELCRDEHGVAAQHVMIQAGADYAYARETIPLTGPAEFVEAGVALRTTLAHALQWRMAAFPAEGEYASIRVVGQVMVPYYVSAREAAVELGPVMLPQDELPLPHQMSASLAAALGLASAPPSPPPDGAPWTRPEPEDHCVLQAAAQCRDGARIGVEWISSFILPRIGVGACTSGPRGILTKIHATTEALLGALGAKLPWLPTLLPTLLSGAKAGDYNGRLGDDPCDDQAYYASEHRAGSPPWGTPPPSCPPSPHGTSSSNFLKGSEALRAFKCAYGPNLTLGERQLTYGASGYPCTSDDGVELPRLDLAGLPRFVHERALYELAHPEYSHPGIGLEPDRARLRAAACQMLKAAVWRYEAAKEASYDARRSRNRARRNLTQMTDTFGLQGYHEAGDGAMHDRPSSPCPHQTHEIKLRLQRAHHDAFCAYAHATIDERLAYARVAYALHGSRRAAGHPPSFEEKPILDDWAALQTFRLAIPDGPHVIEPPLRTVEQAAAILQTATRLAAGSAESLTPSSCEPWFLAILGPFGYHSPPPPLAAVPSPSTTPTTWVAHSIDKDEGEAGTVPSDVPTKGIDECDLVLSGGPPPSLPASPPSSPEVGLQLRGTIGRAPKISINHPIAPLKGSAAGTLKCFSFDWREANRQIGQAGGVRRPSDAGGEGVNSRSGTPAPALITPSDSEEEAVSTRAGPFQRIKKVCQCPVTNCQTEPFDDDPYCDDCDPCGATQGNHGCRCRSQNCEGRYCDGIYNDTPSSLGTYVPFGAAGRSSLGGVDECDLALSGGPPPSLPASPPSSPEAELQPQGTIGRAPGISATHTCPKGEDAAEICAPIAQGDAGGRALEAQCESCGQWTYLTCGDLTRERASCVATEPAQRILNDLTRSSACRLTHYCDGICQEYDQIAHHHRTGGVCGSRRTPFAGAEA